MKTTPSLLLTILAATALSSFGAITASAASQLTFGDTFNAGDGNDVNFQNNAGRQTGAAGVLGYLENTAGPSGPLSRLSGNALRLEGSAANGYTAVTPDFNFNEGGNFRIEFDLDAGVNDPANASGDWACIVFGSSTAGPVFVNGSDGMGILFRNNGLIQVFDGGTGVFGGGALPLGRMHVRIEVESGGFGLGTPATIRMFVDGSPIQIGAATTEHVKATGFAGNYITLAGAAFGGNNWIHEFDNFSVSATPCIRPSINTLNSFVGQNSQVVAVSIPPSLNAAGAVDVVVTSSNPSVAEPVGAVAGSVTLNFPPGTITRSYNIAAHQNGAATLALSTTAAGACVEGVTVVTVGATLVKNPSFEENYNPAFPGYGPINQWTAIPGGNTGVNEAGGPFHDNSAIPDRARVALHQGSGGIRQFISGLQPGREHWLQFRYNKRQGGLMALRTVFAGVEIDSIPSIPVAGTNAYHFRQIAFTPASGSGDLEFRTTASGDATALIDAVTVVVRGPNQVVVQNPSFEAGGFVPGEVVSPGFISGWTGTGSYGVSRSGAGVADNGVNPDQEGVGFMQGIASLSQTINNLVIGQEYRISYSYNVSGASFGGALKVSMGDAVLNEELIAAVGGSAPYVRRTNAWVATSSSARLTFESADDFGSPTILLDDVQILGLSLPPCLTTVSVEKFELVANQPIGPNTINVGLPLYLVATSTVNVVVISLNPGVAIPTGAAVDRIAMTFPQGNTTNLSFSITGVGSGVATFIVSNTLDCASTTFTVRNRTSFVLNPSFEDNSLPAFPGYGQIDDWLGGSGVNDATQPFADNGSIPDRAQVAVIQGAGILSQVIGGLTPGQPYWVQFGYNTRNCCSPAESNPLHVTVRYGGTEIGSVSNITAGGYQAATLRFTPGAASGVLEFIASLPAGGDRTLLLDAVNIVARTADDAVVLNSSFEGTGVVPSPGTVQPGSISGWSATGSYGVNISGAGPFADNGRNPDQDSVAFLQGQSSLVTLAGPLQLGARYRLSYSYNARSGNAPHLLVTVDGAVAQDANVAPVGGNIPYLTHQYDFVATNEQALLSFTQTAAGDQTVLLDSIRVVQTSPGGLRLSIALFDAATVRIAWPRFAAGYTLESAGALPSPAVDWVETGLPVIEEGDESVVYDSVSATTFYRLRKP